MDIEVGFIFAVGAAIGWLAHTVYRKVADSRRNKILRLQPVLGVVLPKEKHER